MNKPIQATALNGLQRKAMRGGVFVCLTLASFWAQAQMAIQSVTGGIQGGVEIIRINTNEPLKALPSGFSIQSPARIALDFPGVANAIGRSTVDINEGNLRSANVVQAGDRTRVVINLKQAASYQTKIEGNTLLVLLERSEAVTAQTSPPTAFAENRNIDVAALRDIDFRRGTGNTGRVVVELPNNQVGVDIRQQGTTLVVEFLKSALPEGLPDIGHQCRQDQTGQGHLGRQKRGKGRNHDHRHGKAQGAFDEARKQRDGHRGPERAKAQPRQQNIHDRLHFVQLYRLALRIARPILPRHIASNVTFGLNFCCAATAKRLPHLQPQKPRNRHAA